MASRNVLTQSVTVTTSQYRAAIARIIRDLQAQHHLTDLDFAERVGCSVGTVRNARNEESDLGGIWLAKIERAFGTGSINPYLALGGSRAEPIDAQGNSDILPFIGRATVAIAEARDPNGPGGVREIFAERVGYLPHLKALQKELNALVCEIEAERAAA